MVAPLDRALHSDYFEKTVMQRPLRASLFWLVGDGARYNSGVVMNIKTLEITPSL